MQTAPTEAQSQLQVLDYYLRSHSDRIFRSLSPSHFCFRHVRPLGFCSKFVCLCWRTKHGTARTTPVAVDPLAARSAAARLCPGTAARTARARPRPPALQPRPAGWGRVRTAPLPSETSGATPATAGARRQLAEDRPPGCVT